MKLRWVIVLFVIGFMVVACGQKKQNYTVGQELTITGKLKIIEGDSTVFVLVTESGELFDIHDLKEEYRKVGITISAVVKVVDIMCLHGSGPAVEVKEYLMK